jgi:phosphatidylserine/phosphatidylglycerophosphate/cardiolipin synthase-like enzyme
MYYLLIGSANEDYRSMLMDGEATVLLSGWSGVVGLIDFSLIVNLSVWIDDLEMLDALIPPPTPLQRTLARRVRFAL